MDINRFVNTTKTVHQANYVIDWIDVVSTLAQSIRVVIMPIVRQLIMELNVPVEMVLLEMHTLNVLDFKDADQIQNAHQAKHVLTVNVAHLASVEFRLYAKL